MWTAYRWGDGFRHFSVVCLCVLDEMFTQKNSYELYDAFTSIMMYEVFDNAETSYEFLVKRFLKTSYEEFRWLSLRGF